MTPCCICRTRRDSTAEVRRRFLDDLAKLNQKNARERSAIRKSSRAYRNTRWRYRMQSSVPELTDLSKEPRAVFERYGPDARKPGTFAANCILARRLAERGVRFIQLFHRGWDQHSKLPEADRQSVPRHRSADGRADPGSERARLAGRHAGHLGRRIRAYGLFAGKAHRRRLWPRPSSALLHDVDGRRRHQRRCDDRRDGRFQLQHCPRSGLTSMT